MNLLDTTEATESQRLYAAGCTRHESPFSGTEYWKLPDGSQRDRGEALAWLRRQEEEREA